jgi:hypothetical protein
MVLLLAPLGFKKWKKILFLVVFFSVSYIIAIALVYYVDLNFKINIIKFIIPLIIFSLAVANILMFGNYFKRNEIVSALSVILFGFFNGLGSSSDIKLIISKNQIEILPILEVVLGYGTSILILAFGVLMVNLIFKKITPFTKLNLIFGYSIIVLLITFPLILKEIFY